MIYYVRTGFTAMSSCQCRSYPGPLIAVIGPCIESSDVTAMARPASRLGIAAAASSMQLGI